MCPAPTGAVGACEYSGCSPQFCETNGLRFKAMLEIRRLRGQLTTAGTAPAPAWGLPVPASSSPAGDATLSVLRVVLSGVTRVLASRLSEGSIFANSAAH